MSLHHLLALASITFATLAHADPGMLSITTDPGDAQIFVNGQRKGNSPSQDERPLDLKLPQGNYLVEARKSDGKNYYGRTSVHVDNDRLTTLNISLAEVKPPAKPYGQIPNGSVKVVGREWLRCSLGQQWGGSSCIGPAKEYTFEEAKAAADTFNATGYGGKRDWRVPTVRELQSLRVCSTGFVSDTRNIQDDGPNVSVYCNSDSSKPTIDTAKFPQMPDSAFWSSSPYAGDSSDGDAWYVTFHNGYVRHISRYDSMPVRLVR